MTVFRVFFDVGAKSAAWMEARELLTDGEGWRTAREIEDDLEPEMPFDVLRIASVD